MNHRKPTAVFEKVDKTLFRLLRQSLSIPTAVVHHNRVILIQLFVGQEFGVLGHVHKNTWVVFQDPDQYCGGAPPLVGRVIMPGDNQHPFGFVEDRLDAIGRHLRLCSPDNRIQHKLAKIWIPPIRIIVTAGKTKTASAIVSLHGPADSKLFVFSGRLAENNLLQPGILFAKSNAIVKLFQNPERLHTR